MTAYASAVWTLVAATLVATFPAYASGLPPADISRLAFRRVGGASGSQGLLAQRVIDRAWGPSDDSVYVEVDVPGWRSEPLAATLSAVLPGAGQVYAGQGNGWLFAAAEAAGWGGWLWYRHDAHRLRDAAGGVAGAPNDAASGWSFERWSTATEGDPAALSALYAADREAFYNSIASDPTYLAGWQDADARTRFSSLRIRSDQRLSRSRIYATGLWLNHLISAVNALRAARFNNMPLSRTVGIRFDGRMDRGAPDVAVALVHRF